MKTISKFTAVILAASELCLFFPASVSAKAEIDISARSAALYEPTNREFLYTKNENERLGMASTTKIMTALIAIENLDLSKEIEIDSRAIGIDGSSVYLKEGEIMSAEALLYSLMLRSANDAAEALAYEICGDIDSFCYLMNERAKSLSLNDTHFKNPHGLDADGHYTTAHDLAIITAEAMSNPIFKKISSTYKIIVQSNLQTRLLVNHNKLLKRYDGCIGVKTGYTKKCGRSLVGAAERNGLTLISVTIDAPNDWSDHKKLLDYGFSRVRALTLIEKGTLSYSLPIKNGEKDIISITNKDTLRIVYKGNLPEIKREIYAIEFVEKDINAGDSVGTLIYKINNETVIKTELIATETVKKSKKKSFFERIFK